MKPCASSKKASCEAAAEWSWVETVLGSIYFYYCDECLQARLAHFRTSSTEEMMQSWGIKISALRHYFPYDD
jgi:hypothetical protein